MAYKLIKVCCNRERSAENPEGWVEGRLRKTTFQKKNKRVRAYYVQLPAGNIVRRTPQEALVA